MCAITDSHNSDFGCTRKCYLWDRRVCEDSRTSYNCYQKVDFTQLWADHIGNNDLEVGVEGVIWNTKILGRVGSHQAGSKFNPRI